MTDRECFEAVLHGKTPERIPWTPRLNIWYEYHKANHSLPDPYKKMDMEGLRKNLNAGRSVRNGRIFNIDYTQSRLSTVKTNDGFMNIIENSKGVITESYASSGKNAGTAIKPARMEFFLKDKNDYDVMIEHIRSMRYTPCFEEYQAYDCEIGDDALPLCIIGDVPATTIIRDYIGYNDGYFHLSDFDEKFEDLLFTFDKALEAMHEILLKSPAKLFLHGMHFDSQMTPPPFFKQYILPYYKKLTPRTRNAGKYIAIHQDGDAFHLVDLIAESGIDVADCLCTDPMAQLTLEKAYDAWRDKVVIWGGIPSIILNPDSCSEHVFLEFAGLAVDLAKSGHMLLSVSDNVMPEADIERVRIISEMLKKVQL